MKEILQKIWSTAIYRHICYWFVVCTVLFVNVVIWETSVFAMQLVVVLVLPAPVPVYLHFYAHDRLFKRRKYLMYIFSFLAITFGSGALIELVFRIVMNDPDSHIGSTATAFFYIVISTALKYSKNAITYQYRLQEAESKQLQTELALLKSQVNPHFFFNTLNNLYSLSLDKSRRVPEVILQLSALMRYVLDSSKEKMVALEDEYTFLENYLSLEKLRFSEETDIRIETRGTLQGRRIAPMLLVPFVENSIKHGINASTDAGYVHIELSVENDTFLFAISNSKTPVRAADDESPNTGLRNVTRRLELLYPDKYNLSIQDEERSYAVQLSISL